MKIQRKHFILSMIQTNRNSCHIQLMLNQCTSDNIVTGNHGNLLKRHNEFTCFPGPLRTLCSLTMSVFTSVRFDTFQSSISLFSFRERFFFRPIDCRKKWTFPRCTANYCRSHVTVGVAITHVCQAVSRPVGPEQSTKTG